ncbi:hypothetical protein [Lusitaniella coriacea]|uniref:hypothetical protein n=1 Tax=Lusitaniella coriacea TaxID=1983105 RepID=UPI003CF16735
MYVYRTPAFNEELEKQSGLSTDHFQSLCADLEEMTLEQVFARFERVYPYLKRKEGNLRLIARVRRVGKDRILCWLAIFRRGDRAYGDFLRDRADFAARRLETQISSPQLQQWLQDHKATNSKPPQPTPPSLSVELLPWLKRPDWSIDTRGSLIYESELWLMQFATPQIQNNWKAYYSAVEQLASNGDLGNLTRWQGIHLYQTEDCSLLYSCIVTSDATERRVLFLLAPFAHPPTEAEIEDAIAAIWESGEPEHTFTLDRLTTLARRAYPSYLLADEENWLLIEREDSTNLALSAEEEAILHDVSTSSASLPLFLNGQAGSGKSTMLFHLFADYCHRHLRYAAEEGQELLATPHPLFLAYNDRLLKIARDRVMALLASHHRFLAQKQSGESDELPDISPFFRSFRQFLRSLLPLDARSRFKDANYVSFYRFRQMLARNHWHNESPERCWQGIRTFIKGYHLDERDRYLDVEGYREVPKKEQTISVEEFEKLYHSVWRWYESQTKAEGLWDDQDLIRTVLKLNCYRPEYTAIFCDEAQDFTRLELQLIMRLSVFSNYDLERYHVECLPFAFAGDPLQTLNPTGFRWESLKAAFYDEVISALSPTGKLNLKMNFAELECNYRSIPAIVGVNNVIQLWRSVLFDLNRIKPQTPRKLGHFEPKKLILEGRIAPETLDSALQNNIIIVPCDEGGEFDYARKDEILSHLLPQDGEEKSPWNVLSAIAAKGLEFQQVILYKFGDACPRDCWQGEDTPSEACKYFFNKLYVATSRATERLWAIDTERGDRQLWERAEDDRALGDFLQRFPNPERRKKWQGKLQAIARGDRETLYLEESHDLAAIAQTFERQGIETENPELLRRAKGAYQRLQRDRDAQGCEAWALKFEGQFLPAGWQFLQNNNPQEAWNCFWQAMAWQELSNLYAQLSPEERDRFPQICEQLPLVQFIAAPQQTLNTLQGFSQFLVTQIQNQSLAETHFSAQWQTAIAAYGRNIDRLIAQSPPLNAQDWQYLGKIFYNLAIAQYQGMGERAGRCFYQGKIYDRAVHCWEQFKKTNSVEYHLAKAHLLGLPTGLNHLLEAKQYDFILNRWKQENRPRDPQWLQAIASALEAKNQSLKALMVYSRLNQSSKVQACFQQASQQGFTVKAIKRLLQHYLKHQQWRDAIAALDKYLSVLLNPEAEKLGLKYWLVYELSHSTLTPETLTIDQRQRLTHFLKTQILPTPWAKHLFLSHVGIALEKVGTFGETLQFYAKYFQNNAVSSFVRDRWLATKLRQAQTTRQQGKPQQADLFQEEAEENANRWGINLDTLVLHFPSAPKQRPQAQSTLPMAGLPTEIPVTVVRDNLFVFQVRHLSIQVMTDVQQVLIADFLTQQQIRIDAQLRQIKIGSATVQSRNGDSLIFSEPASGYQGVAIFGERNPRLELNIEGIADKIAIGL